MFGIEDDLQAFVFQVSNRVADHGEILFESGLQCSMHVKVPGLADQGRCRNASVDHSLQIVIMLGHRVFAPGAAECCDFGIQMELLDSFEKLNVFIVASRDATFNIVHTQIIEFLGNLQLVIRRQTDAFTLGAVTQRRIEDGNGLRHESPPKSF
ncbi:hypothetical protein D3C81_1648330 [compost metagenome]